jgi:DNA-dependent RNA polymerase auxiliary subunit epsilon
VNELSESGGRTIMKIKHIVLLFIILTNVGCVSSKSVNDAREMQQTEGFYSTSLWYHGSTESYHYFTQSQLENLVFSMLKLQHQKLKDVWFKVPFYELYVNDELIFPYGIDDQYKIKAKISSEQPYILKRRAILGEKLQKIISETKRFKKGFGGFDKRIRDAVMLEMAKKNNKSDKKPIALSPIARKILKDRKYNLENIKNRSDVSVAIEGDIEIIQFTPPVIMSDGMTQVIKIDHKNKRYWITFTGGIGGVHKETGPFETK